MRLELLLRSIFAFVILINVQICFAQGGYALDFDGSSSYVEVPYDASLNPTIFTLEAWVKVEGGSGTWRSVITSRSADPSDGKGFILYAGVDNNWQFWTVNGSAFSLNWDIVNTGVAVSSSWTHIACVYDGSNKKVYINGELVADQSGIYVRNDVYPMRIGAGATEGSPDYYFNGKVDELRIWSDERSQAEIQASMHKELTGSEGNLEAYYQMSDGSGTSLTDNSSNSNSGTLNNSPGWKTSGAHAGPGNALYFDGTSEYVNCGNGAGLTLTNSGTLEAWIRPNSLPSGDALLISKFWCYSIELQSDGNIQVYWHGTTVEPITTSSKPIGTGEWYHLATTYDGSTQSIYINGELITSGATSGTISSNTNPLCLAAHSNDPTRDFDGHMDEVRIWTDARTQEEIRANMFRTLEGDEAGLEAYYRFDQQADASHTTLYDYTGNGHDGSMVSMDGASDWVSSTPFNTWIGSESGSVSDGENWSNGAVPVSENIGLFNWNGSNAPSSGNIQGHHLFTASGMGVSLTGNLTLSGNLYNEGTSFAADNATFSGTSPQKIEGAGSNSFSTSMTLNNAAGLSLEQNISVGDLNLTNGALSIGANGIVLYDAITVGSGSLTGGSSSRLTVVGAVGSTGIPAVTLDELVIFRSNGVNLLGNVTVEGNVNLTSGDINLNGQTLTLGSSAVIAGSPGASSHIIATSGNVRKEYPGTGSFTFPVGDGTYYTPISLNFTSGSFSSAYTDVNLTTSKHGSNVSVSNYLNRYWTVNSSGISSFNCHVTATYDESDISGTESELTGAKWDGSAWSILDNVDDVNNQITGSVSGFSDFTAGEANTFPVEWLGFDAEAFGPRVELKWITATETNSHYFAVERSSDLGKWEEIGRIDAAGFSQSARNYSFSDYPGFFPRWQYRLRQVDIDGSFSYSSTVEVSMEVDGMSLYPNPARDHIFIEMEGTWTAELMDINGSLISRFVGSDLQRFDIKNIEKGVYLLLIHNDEDVHSVTLVKE